MRLWSIHPCYLDAKGLVALWREALLARAVLSKKTRGFQHHPQLYRFRKSRYPLEAINHYLHAIYEEALRRGYSLDRSRLARRTRRVTMYVTDGQIAFEWHHLAKKLWRRDRDRYWQNMKVVKVRPHSLFRIRKGPVANWEKR